MTRTDRAARVRALISDLEVEQGAVDASVARLDANGWSSPTLADGWDVRASISHLWYSDRIARLALSDPLSFAAQKSAITALPTVMPDMRLPADMDEALLLLSWRKDRQLLTTTMQMANPYVRVPWFGPDMSLPSFISARIMETWAHGIDVAEAVGAPLAITNRIRHVCHLGVDARRFAFEINGLADSEMEIRVELAAPDGATWTWGPPDARDRIAGSAIDFALLVTQRRHREDTRLEAQGTSANRWLNVAQAFAGPPGAGRNPGLPRVT